MVVKLEIGIAWLSEFSITVRLRKMGVMELRKMCLSFNIYSLGNVADTTSIEPETDLIRAHTSTTTEKIVVRSLGEVLTKLIPL